MADHSNFDTFDNWISRMNFICPNRKVHAFLISLFGTSMLLGFMIGSLTLTNLSDIYGRKPLLVLSLLISTIVTFPLIFYQDNFWLTIFFSFIFGISASSRYSVAYIYSVELSTSPNCYLYGTMCMFGDSMSSVLIGIYFVFFKSFDTSLWFMIVA
jgi:MFS family permease